MARASKIQRARRLLLLRKFATPLRTQRPVASRSAAGGGSPKGHFHLRLWLSGRTDGRTSLLKGRSVGRSVCRPTWWVVPSLITRNTTAIFAVRMAAAAEPPSCQSSSQLSPFHTAFLPTILYAAGTHTRHQPKSEREQ